MFVYVDAQWMYKACNLVLRGRTYVPLNSNPNQKYIKPMIWVCLAGSSVAICSNLRRQSARWRKAYLEIEDVEGLEDLAGAGRKGPDKRFWTWELDARMVKQEASRVYDSGGKTVCFYDTGYKMHLNRRPRTEEEPILKIVA